MKDRRTLWALLTAEVVSSTGTAMTFIALPWFVLETSGSAGRMSLVLAVEVAPMAIFGLPSGSVISRLGARLSMLLADALRAPLLALVPLLHWTGHLTFGALLVIVFGVGTFTAPYVAAQRTIIPELFGDDERAVMKASALFGGVAQVPLLVGPAIAGALVAVFGAPSVLVIDAGTYLFAFVTVGLLIRAGRKVQPDAESRGVLAGLRYLARDTLLGPIVLSIIVLDAAANTISVAIPLLAFSRYDRNPHIAGWIFTGFGVGAVVGSMVVMRLLDRFRPLRLASVGILLATAPLWAIVADIPWPVAAAAVVLCGFFVPMINAPMMGLISTRPPVALRAKVMTAVMTASGLGGPLARIAVGPLYNWRGNAGVWIGLAGAMSLGALLFVAAALRGDRQQLAGITAASV